MQRQHDLPPPGGGADGGRPADRLRRRTDLAPLARPELGEAVQAILADLVSERKPLDIFVLEGTVITGPAGSGRMDMFAGRPMTEWITELTNVASIVVGVGDCATFGGLPTVPPNPSASTGLQFHRARSVATSARTGCPSSGCRSSTSLAARPPRLDQPGGDGRGHRTGRRPGPRRIPPAVHALHDLHPLGLHPQQLLRVQAVDA